MKRILCLLAITTSCAFGQMQRIDDSVTTAAKNVPTGAQAQVMTVPYAKISICGNPNSGSPCQNTVPVFSDAAGTQALTQPLIADAQGRYGFFISPGIYTRSYQSASGTDLGTLYLTIAGPNGQNRIIYADTLTAGDAGAQINMADALLGSLPGTIIYNAVASANGTTAVTLNSKHDLVLQSAITWSGAGVINLMSGSSGQKVSCPGLQTLAHATATAFINSLNGSDQTVSNCRAIGTITSGAVDNLTSITGASTRITITHNSVAEIGVASITTSAPLSTCPDTSQCSYPLATPSNSPSSLSITDNQGSIKNGGSGIFLFISYTSGAVVSGNVGTGYVYGVDFWGGDACLGGCSAGGNGAATNLRKAQNLAITGNTFVTTTAGIWGSMGKQITITGNTVTCLSGGDVGLDLEGTTDSTVSSNTVNGYANGSLATFFLSTRNLWSNNTVTPTGNAALLKNSTNAINGLYESFDHNQFNCPSGCDFALETLEGLSFTNNHSVNLTISEYHFISQVIIDNNTFTYTIPVDHVFTNSGLIQTTGGMMGSVHIGNNIVDGSAASIVAGKIAFDVHGTDFNNAQQVVASGNEVVGFPVFLRCSAESANSPTQALYCSAHDNWSSNVIQTAAVGTSAVYPALYGNYVTGTPGPLTSIPFNLPVLLPADPTASLQAATKQYVDTHGTTGFSGSKTAGSCIITISNGLITAVTGC
jgi:hypothetical protein